MHVYWKFFTDVQCNAGRHGSRKNSFDSSREYNRLAHAFLVKANLFNVSKGVREHIKLEVERYQVENLNRDITDLPVVCMSSDQTNLMLNISLQMEKRIMPEWFASGGEQKHHDAFDQYVRDGRFCNINVDSVVNHIEWGPFLKLLRKNARRLKMKKYPLQISN